MKTKLIIGLALFLSGGLVGCSSIGQKTGTKEADDQPPVTLGLVCRDFNHDGTNDWLSFIWVAGKHTLHDEEPWCGDGEKYTGKFIFRVELANGPTLDTSLESLGEPFDFIFADDTQPWKIEVADYNNDGQPDFNIVTYGSCSYSSCHLFTVTLAGKVEPLKTDGMDSITLNRTSDHSAPEFSGTLTPTGFYYEFFDRLNSANDLEFFDWDAKQKIFHLREQKIPLRP